MKDKFIRILSPIQIFVVGLLDIAVIGYAIFAVKTLAKRQATSVIFFAACVVLAFIVAVLVTKEIVSHGVKFHDDELEFTGIDNDNIFAYEDIVKVETEKDEKASLVKNFVDRQSKIIFTLKDERVVTVYIGITTKSTLKKVSDEIISRLPQSAQNEISASSDNTQGE
ncbi:MAG TPA: hypothetical protein IAA24_01770 [Candidatus Eubacterium faecigallinarum]|nr:hypothetical protein [Candidatus Eubacterium faecigallinarum]